jgi:hypothetical protein
MQSNSRRIQFCTFLSLLLVIVFFVGSFTQDAEARRKNRRRRHRSRTKRQAIINEPKLYERIGGSKAVAELVDEWLRQNIADARVSPQLGAGVQKPEQLAKWRKSWNEEICELAEGPCVKSMKPKKQGDPVRDLLVLDDAPFLAASENLLKSMQKRNLRERDKNELMGRLGGIHADATEDDSEAESSASH